MRHAVTCGCVQTRLTKSPWHSFHVYVQRGEIEEQTQARAEEKLVAALAKASGLKEELARTSELLVEGALER